ncbi:universal stress protein [Pseudomonas sp. PS1]|uniref:Universal stress protein n=1 Tax=Stutzerimonas marianensis TaxID=2929513 RepID=A0A9X2AT96_9GAMM|nr:universal stress protein [Pseudomonas marianensis]MCJ0974824.1 universal stress protein [Pseudomonas marianensis]
MYQILVAHDLSPEADRALARGARLARSSGGRLDVVHVLDEHADSARTQHPREQLQARLAELGLGQVPLWFRPGHVAEAIITQTAGLQADLLILGRHHRQSPSGFAGTTLERILLACPVPVLLAVDAPDPYSRALAALDFSHCASRALRHAWRLMSAGGVLTALNVHEVAEVHGADEADLALQRELFDQLLADLRGELPDNGARLDARLRQGERSNCLDAAVAELKPQLLAFGGHSRGEISEALLGSQTRAYLGQPPCDVLIAR